MKRFTKNRIPFAPRKFASWFIAVLLVFSAAQTFAQLILSDTCNVTGSQSPGSGFGGNGVNYEINSRLSGSAASGLSYLQTALTKDPSAYSILNNKIWVAVAPNPGRFTFTANGTSPKDLGAALGISAATPAKPVVYEVAAKISNQSTGMTRTSFGLSVADGGIQDWDIGIQLVNNGANLELHRRVDSASNPSGADYNNVIATLPGLAKAEIDLRLRITDAGSESGTGNFNSRYEVFANGNLVFTSAPGDFRFQGSATRLILFDTAGGTGPVTFDDFSLKLIAATNPPPDTNFVLTIISNRVTSAGLELVWTSQLGTNYTVLSTTNLRSAPWTLVTNLTAAGTNSKISATIDSSTETYFRVAQLSETGLSLANVNATQRAGSGLVDIFYELADVYFGNASISVLVSTDGGATYNAAAASFSGDIGTGISPGSHHIVWNAGADLQNVLPQNVRIKIVADRSPVAADFALIPSGTFNMGDSKAEGLACERPVHSVAVSAFYLGRHEVTKAVWDDVFQWATNHGYSFANSGVAASSELPIQQISWHDAVKWCNARSEKEGFAPAYFTDFAWKNVYRSGEYDLPEQNVRWQGAGYRLPTEAEWEKAARGGTNGKRFPFGDSITQQQANYWTTLFEDFDVNGTEGPHPLAPEFPNSLPVGSFAPTGYGLYDMAGNTWEWCWDYYGDAWYADGRATLADTRGPSSASWGGDRVYRGGSGVDNAWKSRVANRADAPPRFAMGHFGFRVALPAGEKLVSAESPVFIFQP